MKILFFKEKKVTARRRGVKNSGRIGIGRRIGPLGQYSLCNFCQFLQTGIARLVLASSLEYVLGFLNSVRYGSLVRRPAPTIARRVKKP